MWSTTLAKPKRLFGLFLAPLVLLPFAFLPFAFLPSLAFSQEAMPSLALPAQVPDLNQVLNEQMLATVTPSPTSAPVPTAVPIPFSAPALTPQQSDVLAKDLSDLAAMLAGRWDNDLQIFFEPELATPADKRHDRLPAIVRPIEGGNFGANSFYVEYRKNGENGPVVRQRVWTLSIDPQLAAIRLATFAPKDGKAFEGAWQDMAKLAAIKGTDFVPVIGCDLIWRRRGEGFGGETRPTACKVVTNSDQRVLTVSERHDLSQNRWEVRDIGVDDRGARVFGAADAVPTKLRRANTFVCWAGVPKGNDRVTVPDLVLHDQGGIVSVDLPGGTPNKLRLRLRQIDWPIGQNRPSFTLYILTGDNERADGYAWADPSASRLAVDVGGVQASCTRDDRAMWR